MAKRLTKVQQEENKIKNIKLLRRMFKKRKDITVLGMDISLNGPAFSIINEKKKKHFFIDFKSGGKRFPKIRRTKLLLKKIIKQYKVDLVIRESYSLGSPFQRETLAEIHGVLLYELFRQKIPVLDVAPIQMKKFICGNVKGDKVLIASTLTKEYNLGALPNSNVSDAYGLSIIGYELCHYIAVVHNFIQDREGQDRWLKKEHTEAVFESLLTKKDFYQDIILW